MSPAYASRKHFILRSDREKQAAAEYVLNLPAKPLQEVFVRDYEKIRTLPQNARYWASLNEYLKQIRASVNQIAEYTGHTPLEARRIIARALEPEYVAVLFSNTAEAAHDILKLIVGIPTSTRLGTKKFTEFHERMEQTIALIAGEVNNFVRANAA
jgi:hypothetical protein